MDECHAPQSQGPCSFGCGLFFRGGVKALSATFHAYEEFLWRALIHTHSHLPPSTYTQPDNLLLHKAATTSSTSSIYGPHHGRAVIADFGLVCPTLSEAEHTGA
jgi:hypothetical protein